jgi:hypothetical protein
MVMGRCQYMACQSMLGSGFRAAFVLGSHPDAVRGDREVLLCREHEHLCRPIRDRMNGSLVLTPEGYVYTSFLMEALGPR